MVRKIEVKRIGLGSAMKSVLFASVIPLVISLVLIGLFSAILIAADPTAASNGGMNALSSTSYGESSESMLLQLYIFIVPFLMYPFLAALGALLVALSYNLFASRFGGLKITISETKNQEENAE